MNLWFMPEPDFRAALSAAGLEEGADFAVLPAPEGQLPQVQVRSVRAVRFFVFDLPALVGWDAATTLPDTDRRLLELHYAAVAAGLPGAW